jgi:hypothetical protein
MRSLASRDGADNQKRFFPRCDCLGQRGIRQFVGEIFLAGEETQEGAPLLRDLIANRAAQHGIPRLKRIEHRALRDRTLDLELHLTPDMRQSSKMLRKFDSNHAISLDRPSVVKKKILALRKRLHFH